MKTIVIATDFSDGSKQLARYGFELAKQLRRTKPMVPHIFI